MSKASSTGHTTKGEPALRASVPMLYRRFEQLIDIFREAPTAAPPSTVWAFYLYYLRQVWPMFAALLVVGLIAENIDQLFETAIKHWH